MHEVTDFDRVVVMDGGRVLMQGTPREIFARADELHSVGLAVPMVTDLARRLRTRGIALPEVVLTTAELVAALAAEGAGRAANGNGQEQHAPALAPAPLAPATAPPAVPLIETRDLHYTYLQGTPLAREALRGVSCTVQRGETLAILGGTQAGKSTLIEFFNALRMPRSGEVLFEGRDVAAPGFDIDRLRESVGIVFQQPDSQLFEETVGKDVSYVPRRQGLPPGESRAIVAESLNSVGLDYETFRLRYIHALSGGQKRRVAIAGVLAARPQLLVLDEPVAGLDPRSRAELAALIADLKARLGLTIVLVGNAVDSLAELADRALVLHEGRVALAGPLRELLRHGAQLHDLGLELSEPAEIALALRPLLPGLPTDLLRAEELEEALIEGLGVQG